MMKSFTLVQLYNKVSLDYSTQAEENQFVTNPHTSGEPNPKMAATDHTAVEQNYCSVKNGVNDMLDYIALVVALVAPFIIGPCIVGVFQVIPLYVYSNTTTS